MSYSRTRPERLCDVVIKGGITSGVVYPHAVCELANTYRLKNVGGTSAGAMAAAAAAAAEYGRESGGFERLAELPDWIGADANLVSLFQPQKSTRGLFEILLAGVGHDRHKLFWLTIVAVRHFHWWALLGAIPGIALALLAVLAAGDELLVLIPMLAAALFLAVGGGAAMLLAGLARQTKRAIPKNGFGLCSGMPSVHPDGQPALTPWLEQLIDGLAARATSDGTHPLTFAELWAGPDGNPEQADPEDPWMRLEMMTTNVTNRRSERLPWASREFFFDADQLRDLFSERIVRWLEDHPPALPPGTVERREEQLLRGLLWPLRPLPHAADLPVVVATRLSLSFPILLSAIPLWRVDWSRKANSEARKVWRAWMAEHHAELDAIADDPERISELTRGRAKPSADVCWFSDGGIASNFPIHLFDAIVPRHPTFAINLRPFHPDSEPSSVQSENVWMIDTHREGTFDWWYRFNGGLGGFLGGIVRTMQNRVDDAQMRLPGYRDRVVHVSLTEREGGLNLTMTPEVIKALTERGRWAGRRLVARFTQPPQDPHDLSWDDHRWVRYRSAIGALETMLSEFAEGYAHESEPTYAQLLDRGANEHPASYPVTAAERQRAHQLSDGLVALARSLDDPDAALARSAPTPPAAARIVPEHTAPRRKADPRSSSQPN